MSGKKLISQIVLPSGELWSEDFRENSSYILDWKRAARFCLSADGQKISSEIRPGASPISLNIVRRLARVYAESLKGREALHATGLATGGKAIALLGASGEGKSTLAAALLARGWKLLGDDALSVAVTGSSVVVKCQAPLLKLSPTASRLLAGLAPSKEFDPNLEKWIYRFAPAKDDFPLQAIVFLSRKEKGPVERKRLHGAVAALILQASFYNEILRPRRVLRRQFCLAARLACLVPVWRLSYPTGLRHLNWVAEAIEAGLR